MRQEQDEEQQTNVTKATLSNLHATLAAKENPEPYTGPYTPTSITRSKLTSPGSQTQNFYFQIPVSKNVQAGTNHRLTTHQDTKTYRSHEPTTSVSQVSALRKGRHLTQERFQTNSESFAHLDAPELHRIVLHFEVV